MMCKMKGKDSKFVGETPKSIYLRTKEHKADYSDLTTTSHIRDHHYECHKDIPEDLTEKFAIRKVSSQLRPL